MNGVLLEHPMFTGDGMGIDGKLSRSPPHVHAAPIGGPVRVKPHPLIDFPKLRAHPRKGTIGSEVEQVALTEVQARSALRFKGALAQRRPLDVEPSFWNFDPFGFR